MSPNSNYTIRITTRLRTKYGLYSILRLKDDEDTYIYWLGIIEKLVPLELDFVKNRRLVQENNIRNNGKKSFQVLCKWNSNTLNQIDQCFAARDQVSDS